ncbi:MAG: putative quinol monooxygenase [Trichococcus flocculiformis]
MIVINAEFYIVPEQKKQFLNEISELIQASRKEEGCLSYQLYEAVTDENNFVMVETWGNQRAIELPKDRRKAPCFSYGDIRRALSCVMWELAV